MSYVLIKRSAYVINRSLTFEEGSQGTTISSLSEKSKEETGISLQVNMSDSVAYNNIYPILLALLFFFIVMSFDFKIEVTSWIWHNIFKFMV
jgi:hypothetical protein